MAHWSLAVALPAEQKGTPCRASLPGWTGAARAARRDDVAACRGVGNARAAARRRGRGRAEFPFFLRKRAPVTGVESLLGTRGAGPSRRARAVGTVDALGRGGRAGEEPVPVFEGDLGLRRAQSAVARDVARRGARRAVVERTGALRRGQRVERTLADAQARRREVGHRARVRKPDVRRGPGARRGLCAWPRIRGSVATASRSRTSSRSTTTRRSRASSARAEAGGRSRRSAWLAGRRRP